MLSWMAMVEEKDAVKDLVLQFLASYGGIALGVAFLVGGVKWMAKDWAKAKAPGLAILFTFALGSAAKVLMPETYGSSTFKTWTLHIVVLVFVAILAAGFHDKFLNIVKGKLGTIIPGGVEPPADEKPPSTGGGAA